MRVLGGLVRLAWRELQVRRGPALALMLALIVGVTGFTLLTASSSAQRLETVGTVGEASQQAFDILVRPTGSRLPVESEERLVQPGYLNGQTGISLSQLRQIRNLHDVEVAAPIAVIGYVAPWVYFPVDLTGWIDHRRPATFRTTAIWSLADGSRLRARPQYTVTTPGAVRRTDTESVSGRCGPPENEGPIPPGSTVATLPSSVECVTEPPRAWPGVVPPHRVAEVIAVPFPMLITAIDPVAESQLFEVGEGGALSRLAAGTDRSRKQVPALMSRRSPVRFSVRVRIERLGAVAARSVFAGRSLAPLSGLPGQELGSVALNAPRAYRTLKETLRRFRPLPGYEGRVYQYWSVSGLDYEQGAGAGGNRLEAEPVDNDLSLLWRDGSDFSAAPAGTEDVSFRRITRHVQPRSDYSPLPPSLVSVGTLDADSLVAGTDKVSRILAGYALAPTRDEAGEAVPGSPSIGALVQPPPTLLIDIASLPDLTDGWEPATGAAPLSAIRVKVRGVDGVDDLSRERVRLAAERIRTVSGLDVDVTVGASITTRTLQEPAGRFGRPERVLDQDWVRLGVATQILSALDKKSLILFVLVLLVAAVTTTNSTLATVRSRRTQLGMLACMGWTRGWVLGLVLTELLMLAVAAGAFAFLLTFGLGRVFGIEVGAARAALAVPAAVAVTMIAGALPAIGATRVSPLEAVHPPVLPLRRAGVVRSTAALAWSNVRRLPLRAGLGAAGLAVATATFTLLLAVAVGFQGAVVGSVLGDAVAVSARSADYAAALATLALAGIGMANLTYLNIRDRSVELATLLSLGWSLRRVATLLALENAVVGLLGGGLGAATGYGAAWLLFGALPGSVLGAAAGAAVLATLIAAVAAASTARLLDRLPLTLLLTE